MPRPICSKIDWGYVSCVCGDLVGHSDGGDGKHVGAVVHIAPTAPRVEHEQRELEKEEKNRKREIKRKRKEIEDEERRVKEERLEILRAKEEVSE